jgi:hypothetical protein
MSLISSGGERHRSLNRIPRGFHAPRFERAATTLGSLWPADSVGELNECEVRLMRAVFTANHAGEGEPAI